MPDSIHPAKPKAMDLEIKDAQLIFNRVWNDLLIELGEERLNFPREFFLAQRRSGGQVKAPKPSISWITAV
ncbi:MAG: hypothetical protein LR015_01160 [Verrucomicrobia bacterium]|nr:hypothetical protein [Verrucomicrobiota bacterium]